MNPAKYMENKTFKIEKENVAIYAEKIATWIHKQVSKANRKGVVLGMSGGIDCSVVARLCQLAKVNIHLVMMPCGSDMSNSKSHHHAMELIDKFKFEYHIYDIEPAVSALTIKDPNIIQSSSNTNLELSQANIRPRVRMTYLYELAQLTSRFVVGTGNLAERTVGYFTKWGDGACDFNPLAMLTKQEVFVLGEYLQIPECILSKKPSAGLWEGQTDEDELGMTYSQIDSYILNGTSGESDIDLLIAKRIAMSAHKFASIPIFNE